MVKATWDQENAAVKTDLLKILNTNSCADDLPWLESLLTEKSQKVKEEVMNLLKLFPGSSVTHQYEEVLKSSVTLSKEKGMLGLINKTSIKLKLPDNINDAIFKSGIEKLAKANSNTSDEHFIIYQLISQVPPAFWETQFDTDPGEVVAYFDKYAKTMIPALCQAVIRFHDDDWVPYLLKQPQFYPEFLAKLSPVNQEEYLMRFFAQDSANIIHHALKSGHEWGLKFTSLAVQFMSGNIYQYNRNFFKENIGLINTDILPQRVGLPAIADNANWEKTGNYLMRLLNLKQQIRQVF